MLLERKTYEIFAGSWPYYDEPPLLAAYVVSRSGEVDTSWRGSVLLRDIADVKRLKQEDGPNLVTEGQDSHDWWLSDRYARRRVPPSRAMDPE